MREFSGVILSANSDVIMGGACLPINSRALFIGRSAVEEGASPGAAKSVVHVIARQHRVILGNARFGCIGGVVV